jgi:hypothetical protein
MSVAKPGRNLLASAVLAALATTFLAAPASAQEEQVEPVAGEQEEEAVTLSTITVTAQKREEALQDVPISVTVLDWQQVQDAGIRDIKDLQVLVPGLTVTSTQNEAITTARIRGIGTVGDNAGLESSVGVVIDGVYRPRNSVGFGDLGEIERIEVLKGPQGTVFGKNTSAGVINVMTRRPSYTQRVEGEITAGNYGALGVAGSYNDALSDNAAFRIYAAKRKRDGWMDVVTGQGPRTEDEDYDQNYHLLRGQLLFEPTDDLDINFIADYTSREENCCTAVQLVTGATGPLINFLGGGNAIAIPADPFARVAYSNRSTEQDIKDKGISGEVNWNTPWFGGATLTSITAMRDWQAINGLDFDFTTADLLYRNADKDESFTGFETFSQELRLTGTSGRFDWMVGMFYADEDLDRNESYRIGAQYEPYVSTLVGQQVLGALAAQLAPFAPLGISVDQSNPAIFLSQVSGRPFGTNFAGLGALDQHRQNAKSLAFFTNNTCACKRCARPDHGPALHPRGQATGVDVFQPERQPRLRFHARQSRRTRRRCPGDSASPAGPRSTAGHAGGPDHRRACAGDRRLHVPAVGERAAPRPHDRPGARGERMVRHPQGRLPLERQRHDLRVGRARLQGRRLQPRPGAVLQRPVQRRPGHRPGQRHLLPGRVRQQLRARCQDHLGRRQPAVQRDPVPPDLRGLPAQQLPWHQLRGALDPGSGLAGHRHRGACGSRPRCRD